MQYRMPTEKTSTNRKGRLRFTEEEIGEPKY